MTQPLIIGLTGKRGVGKSEVAGILERIFGFQRVHAFDGGKAATFGYFTHIGIPADTAYRMVYMDLKDKPSGFLPNNATPRYFMERFGRFMGVELGAEWTLGLELRRMRRLYPASSLIAESIVYEDKELVAAGGRIIRVVRPGHEGPVGLKTDEYESQIVVDFTITNSGTLADLEIATQVVISQLN